MANESYTPYPSEPAPITTPTYWSPAHRQFPYAVYDISFSYRGCMGNVLMPVSGQPTDAEAGYGQGGAAVATSAEIVQVSAPWMIVRAEWVGFRTGQPPDVPDWRPPSGSSRYVLHGFDITGKDPAPNATGVDYVFRVSGWVEYFLKGFLTPDDGYPLAASPHQVLPTAVMGVTAVQFNRTIFPL